MKRLFIPTLFLLFSCDSKPTKVDAINYYEQLYKVSYITRPSERKLIDEVIAYYEEYMKPPSGLKDSLKLQNFSERNNQLIMDLQTEKNSITSFNSFEYKHDLKKEFLEIVNMQIHLHQDGISKLINSCWDGQLTKQEANEVKKAADDYENLRSRYKDWKVIRKQFFNDFGITYEDIEFLKKKYPQAEEVKEE